jgi:hypothetical protein
MPAALSLEPQSLDSPRVDSPRENVRPAAELNSHTFGQVAIARGSKWAEASMAALHKKERAQAMQILQLRQDLERAKTQLESSQREAAELRVPRPRLIEATGAPVVDAGSLGGAVLPSIPKSGNGSSSRVGSATGGSRGQEPQPVPVGDEPPPAPPQQQRGRSGSTSTASTAAAALGASATGTRLQPPGSTPLPPQPMPIAPQTIASLTATEEQLRAQLHELEAQLEVQRNAAATERAAAARSRAELEDTRSELVRLSGRHEMHKSTAASVQHDLEARLHQAHDELDAARERAHGLANEARAAKVHADELVRLNEQLAKAHRENEKLRDETRRLHEQLVAVGGKIKSLSSLSDAVSVEERNFLRTLSSMRKEQAQLELEGTELETSMRRRTGGTAAAPSRQRDKPKSQLAAGAALAGAAVAGEDRSDPAAPAARLLNGGAIGGRSLPKLKPPPVEPPFNKAAAAAAAAALAKLPGLETVPALLAGARAYGAPPETTPIDESTEDDEPAESPGRKPSYAAARRSMDRRSAMAALDPEKAERRNAMNQLKLRMKQTA